eukprot:scaffold88767_cov47-Prasinocladus_malaysianus.AAC.1
MRDAAALEQELIGIAVKMEKSMLRKCGGDPTGERVQSNPALQLSLPFVGDVQQPVRNVMLCVLQDITAQVKEDHILLRTRIMKLTGAAGVERMETAISKARTAVQEEIRMASAQAAAEQAAETARQDQQSQQQTGNTDGPANSDGTQSLYHSSARIILSTRNLDVLPSWPRGRDLSCWYPYKLVSARRKHATHEVLVLVAVLVAVFG